MTNSVQGCLAGDDELDARRRRAHGIGHAGNRLHQVFGVVQRQQDVKRCQSSAQRRQRFAHAQGDAQRQRHRRGHGITIAQTGQVHPTDTMLVGRWYVCAMLPLSKR